MIFPFPANTNSSEAGAPRPGGENSMSKRIISVFCVIILMMTGTIYRIYYINMSDYLTTAASVQGQYFLDVAASRGGIYDRNLRPLVNRTNTYIASVLPTPMTATVLMEHTPEEEREAMVERLSAAKPFLLPVEDINLYADGIDVFRVPVRYGEGQLAPHLIGYLGGDGISGVAGVEKAFDEFLKEQGIRIRTVYQTDAAGHALQGGMVTIRRTGEEDGRGGVVLSLDADIQRIAEEALASGCGAGAAVVLEVATGDILAMASLPGFDQSDLAASLDSEDAPFINRGISGYNIGSVFKLVVSAAALESGYSRYFPYECRGYVDVDGQIFRCNNHAVHGALDMQRALQVSCNCYFINLAQEMDYPYLLALCEHLGLGSAAELAPGLSTQSGNLPAAAELRNPAGLANFAFGQGSSLATPLQMAQIVATIAGGGAMVTPRLVLGTTEDGRTISDPVASYAANQVLSERTAATLREMMISVVEEGSGKPARPIAGSAGGKTSSAQTGRMEAGEDGEEAEIVHAWFAGFFPAQAPRYSVVVFCEGGESGERTAAPIFKKIADGIAALKM